MNESNPFNPAAIERLVRLGGEKFAVDMIDLFFSYGAKKVCEARQARDAGNLTALADAAHPLKSSAGNVGATRVQELAAQVESSARAQNAELSGTQFDEMERAFAGVKLILESERARMAKPPA
jgi:HPt (histidine-containing phosphotransfer) domain-containing protein